MEQPRNPFELMMNPTAVIEAMERSRLLAQLHSRIYRPLDRPLLRDKPATEAEAFDRTVEQSHDVLDS
jgi:hypothetical protein